MKLAYTELILFSLLHGSIFAIAGQSPFSGHKLGWLDNLQDLRRGGYASGGAGASNGGDVYRLKRAVKKVAIIGAGPGGLISYRELSQNGFEVHIYERDDVPGGNWHYTDDAPPHAPIPNANIAVGDYIPTFPPNGVGYPFEVIYNDTESSVEYRERRRTHRGPKPVWKTLHSNAPSLIQQIPELPWPRNTPLELPQERLSGYIRAFASYHNLNSNDENPNVHYNTRIELVEKHHDAEGNDQGWRVISKEYKRIGLQQSRVTWREEFYDAVVVATGRYNAPNMPSSITGLTELNRHFPGRFLHSREYRVPEPFRGETILIVGAATSAVEIARDLNPYAKRVFQSIRPSNDGLFGPILSRLPENVTRIPEIKEVRIKGSTFQDSEFELINGTVFSGFDRVIFGTGYLYSFPFLPGYHNTSLSPHQEARRTKGSAQPIVTDGSHLRALHLDLLYIPDPTLAFINMNNGMQSFTYAEYLALSLAKVWSERAFLPSEETQWALYDEKVKERGGYSKRLLYLGAKRTRDLIRYFVGWLNDAAYKFGGRQVDVPPPNDDILELWAQARFGIRPDSAIDSLVPSFDRGVGMGTGDHVAPPLDRDTLADLVFSDWW